MQTDLPGNIIEHLKNNNLGFNKISERDSLEFVDAEFIEYLK